MIYSVSYLSDNIRCFKNFYYCGDMDDKISDDIVWFIYDKQELISNHVINE